MGHSSGEGAAEVQRALAATKACMAEWREQLQAGSVRGLLRRRGWPQLEAYCAQLYGDTCGHFHCAAAGAHSCEPCRWWLGMLSLLS